MKTTCLILAIILALSTACYAATTTIMWDAVPGATGYKAYQSLDNGTTWTYVMQTTTNQAAVTHGDTGVILLRVSAFNNTGEAIRLNAGIMVWPDAPQPPPPPTGLGVH